MLGHCSGIRSGCVGDRDSHLQSCLQIDIVCPCAPDGYESELRAGNKDLSIQPGIGPDVDDNVESFDPLNQFLQGVCLLTMNVNFSESPQSFFRLRSGEGPGKIIWYDDPVHVVFLLLLP